LVEKYTLNNGIRVICDDLNFFKTFSMGFWIKIGSLYETPSTNGYTHLLEHMLFKGTQKRSYSDISMEIDSVGGFLNAFTERENTCFYVNVMTHHLDLGVDILWDMITNSTIDESELEKEKMVVIEEIKMTEDTPEELVHDLFFANLWKTNPLGFPILGNIKNIKNANRHSVMKFFKDYYSSHNLIISLAGNFDKKELLKQIDKFTFIENGEMNHPTIPIPNANYEKMFKVKKLEQVYFIMAYNTFSRHDPRKYILYLLNNILGGGSSSRLFLEIRERLGLCYSIFSFHNLYNDCGFLGITSSTSLENYPFVIESILKEIEKLIHNGVLKDELERSKEQMKGNITFQQENLESRMNRNAKNELNYHRHIPNEEVIAELEKVTINEINNLINEIFKSKNISFCSIGPKKHAKILTF